MKPRVEKSAWRAMGIGDQVIRDRRSAALIPMLMALGTLAHGQQQANESTQPTLLAGDKVSFQWPGTESRTCGVVGASDVGVDGTAWVWVQPVDLPSAIIHVAMGGIQRGCSRADKAM